ncbi:hypothetical protein [Virgibacillus kimchii]
MTIADDVEIFNRSENVDGIFWSREYAGITSGNILSNIGRAILVWVEPGSKIFSSYEALTAPTETETGNDTYTYYDTVEGQETAYGEVIDEIGLFDSGSLRNNNDYLLIMAQGTNVDPITQGFNYTIVYQ